MRRPKRRLSRRRKIPQAGDGSRPVALLEPDGKVIRAGVSGSQKQRALLIAPTPPGRSSRGNSTGCVRRKGRGRRGRDRRCRRGRRQNDAGADGGKLSDAGCRRGGGNEIRGSRGCAGDGGGNSLRIMSPGGGRATRGANRSRAGAERAKGVKRPEKSRGR